MDNSDFETEFKNFSWPSESLSRAEVLPKTDSLGTDYLEGLIAFVNACQKNNIDISLDDNGMPQQDRLRVRVYTNPKTNRAIRAPKRSWRVSRGFQKNKLLYSSRKSMTKKNQA